MDGIRTSETPTDRENIGRGLRLFRSGLIRRFNGRWLNAEHGGTEVSPESRTTFLVRTHGAVTWQVKCEDDFYQKAARRQAFTTAQIRRVRVRHAYPVGKLLIGHPHVAQYGGCLTVRQRVGTANMRMEHDLKLSPDMDELLALHRDRWTRARALAAAVAFHAYRFVSESEGEMRQEVIKTAEEFAAYIRDGKEGFGA